MLPRRLWLAIVLVTLASVILSFEGEGSLVWNEGSLLVLGACVCWGVENNCTKMLSSKSSVEIVIIKGIFSGLGSLAVALLSGEVFPALYWALAVMALGFVAYGLSINYYILAQRDLGAAKTSAYYALAPFLGVGFSMALLGGRPALQFYIALALMAGSAILMTKDTIALQHSHLHTHVHSHEHSHNGHAHTHLHAHQHCHLHIHPSGDETHSHTHKTIEGHQHAHPLA